LKATDDRGFTLIEVLVATVVMTIALVSLAELMAITLRLQQLGRNQTAAVRLAQDKLDQLMSLSFDTAPAIAVGGSLDTNIENYNDALDGYQRRWLVEATDVADLRQVTVRLIPDVVDRRTSDDIRLVTIIRRW